MEDFLQRSQRSWYLQVHLAFFQDWFSPILIWKKKLRISTFSFSEILYVALRQKSESLTTRATAEGEK